MAFATRLLLLFGLAITSLGAAAPPAPSDALLSLLAHMRERSGPVWATHLHSNSQIFQDGHPLEIRTDAQGLRFATYQCAGNLCEGSYFDGERVYSINVNGTTLPDGGDDGYLRAQRTISSLDFLSPDFTSQGGKIFDDGVTGISHARYRTLLITNGDAVPMLIFIDPKTFTIRYLRDINGDNTFEYDRYEQVGRLWLPAEVRRNGALLERYEHREVASGTFATPHGPVATFANGPVAVKTDPNHITPVFPCTIDGIATNCLLDSGNSGLSISLSLAEQLNLPEIGSFQVRGLGDYATEMVRGGTLQIGTMNFAPANYVVLSDIDRFGYQVVLGADLFASTTIEMDQARHRLVFGATPPPHAVSVPLFFQDFVPVVDVHLGSLPTELAVDTGDESSINLAYDFYQEHHDLFSATSARPVSGIGGTSIELLGTIPQIHVGDLAISSPTIGATRTLQGTAYGHLGVGLLSRFDVTIDYASAQIQLVAPGDSAP